MLPSTSNSLVPENYLVPATAKPRFAQLQIPSGGQLAQSSSTETRVAPSVSLCDFRSLFEENVDKLKSYIQISRNYHCQIKSFSTSDMASQVSSTPVSGETETGWCRRYLSECDLAQYQRWHATKESLGGDYITYSCSTLAICGDTMHSSQLPSPQNQSARQLNAFIFTDLDLIKSINKKVRNQCITKRVLEFIKSVSQSSLEEHELDALARVSSGAVVRPLQVHYSAQTHDLTDNADILIQVVDYEKEDKYNCVSKKDKEMFVLNWLQTVQPGPHEPE